MGDDHKDKAAEESAQSSNGYRCFLPDLAELATHTIADPRLPRGQ